MTYCHSKHLSSYPSLRVAFSVASTILLFVGPTTLVADSQDIRASMKIATTSPSITQYLPNKDLRQLMRDADSMEETLLAAITEASWRGASTFRTELINLIQHSNYKVKIAAMKSVSKGPSKKQIEVIDALYQALQDEDFLIRAYAARILLETKSPIVFKALKVHRRIEINEVVRKVLKALEEN